jgi:hypothetical protein
MAWKEIVRAGAVGGFLGAIDVRLILSRPARSTLTTSLQV